MQAGGRLEGRLSVTCVGDDSIGYQPQADVAGLGGILHFLPSVSFEECQRWIGSCQLTLIIDTPGYGGVFLPTKLFEAFASERPVLGLAEAGSAVADILQQAGLAWADVTNPAHIAEVLSKLLAEWEAGRTDLSTGRREVIEAYEIDRVNAPLAELFHRLAAKGRST